MKQIHIYIILAVIIIALGVFFISQDRQETPTVTSFEECVAAGYDVMESYPRQCSTPDGETFVESVTHADAIRITQPAQQATIGDGDTVSGEARGTWFFEGDFSATLYDAHDREIGTVILTAQEPWMTEEFIPFSGTIRIEQTPLSETGSIIFNRANPSGLEENAAHVEIPIQYETYAQETTNVFLYFPDPDTPNDCQSVVEVARAIPKTEAIAQSALQELLKGPRDDAYFSAIPAGTTLNSIRIEDGTAYADFSAELQNYAGGSCNVAAITTQITRTLEQFASVEDVAISVEGETEEILQP